MMLRFTIGAIAPNQRKARESNPHARQGALVSTEARPTVSGYLPADRLGSSGPAGESNPDLLVAGQASSHWTSRPDRSEPAGPAPHDRRCSPIVCSRGFLEN